MAAAGQSPRRDPLSDLIRFGPNLLGRHQLILTSSVSGAAYRTGSVQGLGLRDVAARPGGAMQSLLRGFWDILLGTPPPPPKPGNEYVIRARRVKTPSPIRVMEAQP